MITFANNDFPEIEWERTDEILDNDPEERMTVYAAYGESKDGRKFSASAVYICGEWEAVNDIEEVESKEEEL